MEIINKIIKHFNCRKRVLLSWYAKHFMKVPRVLSVDETLNLIIKGHYSVSRNGDGELNLMIGESIDFQDNNPRLAQLMRDALNAKLDKYLSCLPSIFVDYSRFNDYSRKYFDGYLRTKRFYYYSLAKAPVYGDTLMSRFYIDFKDKSQSARQIEKLKKIWEGQNVVLLEGKESRLGVNNDLFNGAKTLKRILGPAENAFDRFDDLMVKVQEVSDKNTLILLALGPTATVMAYELAKNGFWAVDIGHIDIEYEWYLMGATSKVGILGKYTNECDAGKLTGRLPEEALFKYNSEIIAKIL